MPSIRRFQQLNENCFLCYGTESTVVCREYDQPDIAEFALLQMCGWLADWCIYIMLDCGMY